MFDEFRYAMRSLYRVPTYSVGVILTLALGLAANAIVFSIVYPVLLKPLPYDSPSELVRIFESPPTTSGDRGRVSADAYLGWRSQARTLQGLAAYTPGGRGVWQLADRVELVQTAAVSGSLFGLLRVPPLLGRVFNAGAESKQADGVLISFDLWQRGFGGRSDILDQSVLIESRLSRRIIGVMPPKFDFPDRAEAWTPLAVESVPVAQRTRRGFGVLGRLSPDVTLAESRAELRFLLQKMASSASTPSGSQPQIELLAGSDTQPVRLALTMLMGSVAAVLLIACVNAASLSLSRATATRRDLALRISLGADSKRLVGRCVAEAIILAAGAVAFGAVIWTAFRPMVLRRIPTTIPRLDQIGGDERVVWIFAGAMSVVVAVLMTTGPALMALRAERTGLRPDMEITATGSNWRAWLLAAQAFVAVMVVSTALLSVRTLIKLRHVDLGFDTSNVLAVEARWPFGHIMQPSPGQRPWRRVRTSINSLISSVESVPGVQAVGLVSTIPLTGAPYEGTARGKGAPGLREGNSLQSEVLTVTPGYFEVMKISLLRGRLFNEADTLPDETLDDQRIPRVGVAVVNQAFAKGLFAEQDAVGKTIVLPEDPFAQESTIIGVVADVRARSVDETARPAVLVPHNQHPGVVWPSLVVQTSLSADQAAATIRRHLQVHDPLLLVQRIRPMQDVVSAALVKPTFNALLATIFAALALSIAAVGAYAVVSLFVVQRHREIGVRMMLGANGSSVLGFLLRRTLTPVLYGLALGTLGSLVIGRGLRSLLFQVSPSDPTSLLLAPTLFAIAAGIACYFPARRALRTDPVDIVKAG